MNWKQLVRLAKKEYGLKKLVWKTLEMGVGASCKYRKGIIYLSKDYRCSGYYERKICALYHELGHIYCYKNGIWKNAHTPFPNNSPKKRRLLVLRVALKAERWIDNWAAKEMNKYFPHIEYHYPYTIYKDSIDLWRKRLKKEYGLK